MTNEEYKLFLDKWAAQAPSTEHEGRLEAVKRTADWISEGDVSEQLDLSGLNLSSLPEFFPHGLIKLDVSNNNLTEVPDNLPETLTDLDIHHNKILSIPPQKLAACTNLTYLDISHNSLVGLPPLPSMLEMLNVSNNNILLLPSPLPAGLELLDASHNKLINLPEHLPDSLEEFNIGYNNLNLHTALNLEGLTALETLNIQHNQLDDLGTLRGLDDLESLTELYAQGNGIYDFPDGFLPTLQILDISDNLFTVLPSNLPPDLITLNVSNNYLSSVPVDQFSQELAESCNVILTGNRFSADYVTNDLQAALTSPDYNGPTLVYEVQGVNLLLASLNIVVSDWFPFEQRRNVSDTWSNFIAEDSSGAFNSFLTRLSRISILTDPNRDLTLAETFREQVADWLVKISTSPALRKKMIDLAIGASETCNDRISLTWNWMQRGMLVAEIESGGEDNSVSSLLAKAREIFRLDMLEKIAGITVSELTSNHINIDEIEVYLGYQIGLKEDLNLTSIIDKMDFVAVSHLDPNKPDEKARLIRAAEMVREAENRDFVGWLAEWEPWQQALSRIAPDQYQAALERRADAFGAS
ncbi:NEL-type E3 ubiquitin ligase domain-containing protein, partial [Enterobacter sp. A103]|uniref:NEL-type E3 ubiquitin ligase domain-containing protein n=1 Tax=Enterobacter sp. A103 TaxID=3102785 RepID=UPI002ACA23E5